MASQVSVLIENKPGKLQQVSEVLSKNNINIRALTISDTGIYGVIKLLLNKPQEGCAVLSDEGISASIKDIIAIESENVPGGLFGPTKLLSQNNINVEDAYGFSLSNSTKSIFIFQVDETEKTRKMLSQNGYKVLSEKELDIL